MNVLMVLSDARAYDGLRLALSLASLDDVQVRTFFVGDAVRYLAGGETTPRLDELLENLAPLEVEVACCGTSLDAHVGEGAALSDGARRSSMQELAAWTLWADRVLTW